MTEPLRKNTKLTASDVARIRDFFDKLVFSPNEFRYPRWAMPEVGQTWGDFISAMPNRLMDYQDTLGVTGRKATENAQSTFEGLGIALDENNQISEENWDARNDSWVGAPATGEVNRPGYVGRDQHLLFLLSNNFFGINSTTSSGSPITVKQFVRDVAPWNLGAFGQDETDFAPDEGLEGTEPGNVPRPTGADAPTDAPTDAPRPAGTGALTDVPEILKGLVFERQRVTDGGTTEDFYHLISDDTTVGQAFQMWLAEREGIELDQVGQRIFTDMPKGDWRHGPGTFYERPATGTTDFGNKSRAREEAFHMFKDDIRAKLGSDFTLDEWMAGGFQFYENQAGGYKLEVGPRGGFRMVAVSEAEDMTPLQQLQMEKLQRELTAPDAASVSAEGFRPQFGEAGQIQGAEENIVQAPGGFFYQTSAGKWEFQEGGTPETAAAMRRAEAPGAPTIVGTPQGIYQMPEDTGKFEALPMGEQPAQMEFHYGMPFMRGTQGSLEPLNDILTKRKEQAFIDGEFDLAMVLDDFQNRPNPQQYMDTMMQYMRSPADQSLLSSIARGYQALPPGVAGEINRVGPVPEAERKAWERYEAAATGAPSWEDVQASLQASDEERKKQTKDAIDAQKLEQKNMVDALRAEHKQSLAAVKEESKANLEKIRDHIAQTIAAGKSDADERVSKLQSVIDKLQNVGASSTDDGSDVWPRTVMIDGKSMTFQDRESYNKYLSGAGGDGFPEADGDDGITWDQYTIAGPGGVETHRPIGGPEGVDLRQAYIDRYGIEVSGRMRPGEFGYVNGNLVQFTGSPYALSNMPDKVRYNIVAMAPWNTTVENGQQQAPMSVPNPREGTERIESGKVSREKASTPSVYDENAYKWLLRQRDTGEALSGIDIPSTFVGSPIALAQQQRRASNILAGDVKDPDARDAKLGLERERRLGNPGTWAASAGFPGGLGTAAQEADAMREMEVGAGGGRRLPRKKPPAPMNYETDRYARGGTTFNDTLALVGEEGPEMVKLPAGATVMPADVTDAIRRGKRPVPMVEGGVVFGGYGQEAAAPTRFSDIYGTTDDEGPFYTTQAGLERLGAGGTRADVPSLPGTIFNTPQASPGQLPWAGPAPMTFDEAYAGATPLAQADMARSRIEEQAAAMPDSPIPARKGPISDVAGVQELLSGRQVRPLTGRLLEAAGLRTPSAQAWRNMSPDEQEIYMDLVARSGISPGYAQREMAAATPSGSPRSGTARVLPLAARRY